MSAQDSPNARATAPTAAHKRSRRRQLLDRLVNSFTTRLTPSPSADGARPSDVIDRCRALLSVRGEASGLRLAADVIAAYRSLDRGGLTSFFDLMSRDFEPDASRLSEAVETYRGDPSPLNVVHLQHAVESPRQELFRRLNMAPGGTPFLVQMRRQLLEEIEEHPGWVETDADLKHLFRSWFNRGFLVMRQIDWHTSAVVLERLIQYEAVHQIQGWHDLHRRLEGDRRCYAFFSPALPDEPLIFIEVALTRGLPESVQPLLDPDAPVADPSDADCAAFYSITNCQEGLRGISFGNFLIKQVVEDLGAAFRRLRTFGTISPIPGFTRWLASSDFPSELSLSPELASTLDAFRRDSSTGALPASLQPEVSRLCAYYLLHAKRGRAPLDRVARFHLANGSRLERVNWMGDTSPKGFANSLGLTVNYVYRLGEVERNHEAYAKDYAVVASRELERLAVSASLRGSRSHGDARPHR